jgi:transcriptional regulator with XRE-family HTH domain
MKYTDGGVTLYGPLARAATTLTRGDRAYLELVHNVSDQIATLMEQEGLTRKALADRLGVSKANVTKLLSGQANLTLKTLATVLTALQAKVEVHIHPARKSAIETDGGLCGISAAPVLQAVDFKSPATRSRAIEAELVCGSWARLDPVPLSRPKPSSQAQVA